jgi:hypothetical protein
MGPVFRANPVTVRAVSYTTSGVNNERRAKPAAVAKNDRTRSGGMKGLRLGYELMNATKVPALTLAEAKAIGPEIWVFAPVWLSAMPAVHPTPAKVNAENQRVAAF